MRLCELFNGIQVINSNTNLECEVAYITNDHRKVRQNYIFVAIKGQNRNGADYISLALEKGAVAIVTQEKDSCDGKIPYILVDNVRSTIAKMWSNYYDNPAKDITTVAITGTNGKTSSAYFLYSILQSSKIPCGLISTIECLANGEKIYRTNECSVSDINSAMTTPDPESLYSIYGAMRNRGVKIVVMEASSHALEQNRLDGIEIEIGAFTNLTSEHMDYHKNIDDYFNAKEKLMKKSKLCVINADDEYGKLLAEKYSYKSVTFSLNNFADFYANECKVNLEGCRYSLNHKNQSIRITTKTLGNFNIYNSMLAASCAKLLGIDNKYIKQGIEEINQIKGRLERYKNKNIYIDYAHTPDAMRKVIMLFKEIEPQKKLTVLFGCGGERDREKRSEMGNLSTTLADFTVITSDNSRGEDPKEIIADILKGVLPNRKYTVIVNREEAIKYIAKKLKKDEILLLLGKGHEAYEITSSGKKHFDEREVLDEVFQN